jgi:TonB family protein
MAMTTDLVSSSIIARQREPEGLRKMMVVSGVGHVVAIAACMLLPSLIGTQRNEPVVVMEIGLASAPGPVTGGMSSISGRAVQKVEPKPELPKPEPVRPPAAKTPEMVQPTAKPTPPKPTQRQSSQSTRQAPPTTGEAIRQGTARSETGSTSNEGGLSTGGGGTGAQMNNVSFCDPEYLGQMISLIHRNWNQNQTVSGRPVVRYVIQRDGTLTDITLRQSSGYTALDLNSLRAVQLTRAIPPLPSCYPHQTYAMNLTFEYIR